MYPYAVSANRLANQRKVVFLMTQNQIAYQQLQETKRHNEANEAMDRSKQAVNIANAAINPIVKSIQSFLPWAKFLEGGK